MDAGVLVLRSSHVLRRSPRAAARSSSAKHQRKRRSTPQPQREAAARSSTPQPQREATAYAAASAGVGDARGGRLRRHLDAEERGQRGHVLVAAAGFGQLVRAGRGGVEQDADEVP